MSDMGSSSIKSVGGIDTRFSRESNRFSNGSNFYTKGGSMFTRPGTSALTANAAFTGNIVSMVQAPLPSQDNILIVQHGSVLYHWTSDAWGQTHAITSADPLNYCRFINKIVMVNGTDRIMYDIVENTYSSLVVSGSTEIPAIEYATVWKFRVFGWMPNGDNGHLLYFCGYDTDDMIDPTVWPPDFTLNVGGSVGSPIYDALPCGNHLLVLTENSYTPVYGNTEDDFEVGISGQTNVLRPGVAGAIGENIIWVGKDTNSNACIYMYSGTEPIVISDPLQDFLPNIDLTTLFVEVFRSQFWLICPGTTTTRCYIFDTAEGEWYIYDYPFIITSGTMFGEQGEEDYIHFGSSSKVIKGDPLVDIDLVNHDITTSFKWGPIALENRLLKPQTLYVVAESYNDFTLSVIQVVDNNPVPEALAMALVKGTTVNQVTEPLKLPKDKGYNLSYDFSTTDKVNKINGLTIVFKAKEEK